MDFHVKQRLLLNDRAGIRVNKNFKYFVVEADGHKNLTFDTTYLINKYGMYSALFVGVNHHGQSVLLQDCQSQSSWPVGQLVGVKHIGFTIFI